MSVKIRLEGLPADVAAAAQVLVRVFTILEESRDYPNRPPSQFVRRYITVGALVLDSDKQETATLRGEEERKGPGVGLLEFSRMVGRE